MSDVNSNAAIQNAAEVLHIVLTASLPPSLRMAVMRLVDALVEIFAVKWGK